MLIVFTTTASIEEARKLASLCVEQKLAACVQIIPSVESVYEWEGVIKSDSECLLLLKTAEDKFDQLEEFLGKEHSYDVPEIVAVRTELVSKDYKKWLLSVIS